MSRRAMLYGGQFRAIEETLESWKVEHDEAMGVRDLEDVIQLCLSMEQGTRRMVADLWEAGFNGWTGDLQRLGQQMLRALDQAIRTWSVLFEEAEAYRNRGHAVDNGDKLPGVIAELKSLREDFASRWPMFTTEELERGRDQIARGEFVTEEELVRALQGEDRQAG